MITHTLRPSGAKGEPGVGISTPGPQGVPGPRGETGRPGLQGEQHHSWNVFIYTPLQKNPFKICLLMMNQ